MGLYKIETTPEEDEKLNKLKYILGEKTASKTFKKLLNLRLSFEDK